MSHASHVYPLSGKEYKFNSAQQTINIDLAEEGVPHGAYKVIVYAKIQSGYNGTPGKDESGDLVVSTKTINGQIERSLNYHTYNQSSWSFNSENIPLPVAAGYTKQVKAELKGPFSKNFSASVQIVSYSYK